MSLEDEIPDVIAKAMMGLELEADGLAEKSGLSVGRIEAVLRGDPDEDSLRKIAPALGLDTEALLRLPAYLPAEMEIPGVRKLVLPFGQWTVNAWLVEHDGIRLLFDTGCEPDDITAALGTQDYWRLRIGIGHPRQLGGTMPNAVFITHAHGDHVGGTEAFETAGVRVISETEALGTSAFGFGSVSLRVVDLSGHMTPTAGYFIDGLEKKLLVAGDAIFAGSIGRCRFAGAYQAALENLRRVLREAGPECVILPGHGPASTVAEEFSSHPFHPSFA